MSSPKCTCLMVALQCFIDSTLPCAYYPLWPIATPQATGYSRYCATSVLRSRPRARTHCSQLLRHPARSQGQAHAATCSRQQAVGMNKIGGVCKRGFACLPSPLLLLSLSQPRDCRALGGVMGYSGEGANIASKSVALKYF